jgi:hypothetical protein
MDTVYSNMPYNLHENMNSITVICMYQVSTLVSLLVSDYLNMMLLYFFFNGSSSPFRALASYSVQ